MLSQVSSPTARITVAGLLAEASDGQTKLDYPRAGPREYMIVGRSGLESGAKLSILFRDYLGWMDGSTS